jgi:diguanylate cyclase (GGDEF)-like protein
MRVVVAHRREGERRRLAEVLRAAGHEVLDAGDAHSAVVRCLEWIPDVAVLDVALCADGGCDLIGRVKADADAYGVALVLIEPAELELEAAVAALARGVQDFLVEPVRDAELVARVHAAGRTKILQEELMQQSRRLETMIFEDPLTRLANRRSILTTLAGLVSAARRHDRPLSAAIVDVDHFKAINDRHGHAAGDRVLATVAGELRAKLRAEDQLGRLGGEEFLVLLPDADAAAAAVASGKLRDSARAVRVDHEGQRLRVTVSVGWATWDDETPESLLRRADEALYAAKAAGRDRVEGAPATVPRRT